MIRYRTYLLTGEKIEDDIIQSEYWGDMQATIIQIDVTLAKSEKPSFKFKSSDCSAKLPKLSLKTFNGNPLEYQSFWNCFKAAVHQNDSLEDLTELNYLRSYLVQGQACIVVIS